MTRNPFVRHGLARMEGYAMDTDIDITVNEDEAAVESEEFAEEEAAEVAETEEVAGDIDATAEETMRLLADLDIYESFYSVVKEYGASRPVVDLMLAYDMDPKMLGIQVDETTLMPKCENFGMIGIPTSAETVACLEGIGETVSKTINWLIEKCKEIMKFVAKIFDLNGRRIKKLQVQISAANKLIQASTRNAEKTKDASVKGYSTEQIRKIGEGASRLKIVKDFVGSALPDQKATDELLAFGNNIVALKTAIKEPMESRPIASMEPSVPYKVAKDLLDAMVNFQSHQNRLKQSGDEVLKKIKASSQSDDKMTDSETSEAKKAVAMHNKVSQSYGTAIGVCSTGAARMLKMVYAIIKKGYDTKQTGQPAPEAAE